MQPACLVRENARCGSSIAASFYLGVWLLLNQSLPALALLERTDELKQKLRDSSPPVTAVGVRLCITGADKGVCTRSCDVEEQ